MPASGTGVATGLDHVGLAVEDLDAAALAWQAAGFTVTPLARHQAAGPDGVPHPTGTANRCIMLGEPGRPAGYVELLAVIDPTRPSATLAGFLARWEGIHILSLATPDADAAQARLARAGLAAELVETARDADGGQASFRRLPLPGTVPRLQLLQQMTPALLWQDRLLRHPNHAVALESVVIACAEPFALAALLSRAAGRPLQLDRAGFCRLDLAHGAISIVPPESLGAMLPGVTARGSPHVAGIVLRTADGNRAVAAMADARPVPGGHLMTATGTAILFRAG